MIDFGLMRQLKYDSNTRVTTLETNWISKASAQQRSGRCGRLFAGVAFRFYTQNFYEEQLPEYEIPEMLRLSLTSTVLRLKLLESEVIVIFFSSTPVTLADANESPILIVSADETIIFFLSRYKISSCNDSPV